MTNRNLTAPTPLQNAFLSSYLLADVLFSRFCYPEEMRAIFDQYAKTFCIHNKEWLEQIWEVVSSDLFSLADNAGDFNRLVRLSKQFPDRLTDDELYVLTRKSVAIKTKTEILLGDDDAPFETVIRTLERRADGNDTDCMALYGFIAGILASNSDITDIFVDSALKICQNDEASFDVFLNELEALVKTHEINCVITSSLAVEEASETVKKFIVE